MSDLRQIVFGVNTNAWHLMWQYIIWALIITAVYYIVWWVSIVTKDYIKAGKERVRKYEEREARKLLLKTGESK
jgi:hypothetical protein